MTCPECNYLVSGAYCKLCGSGIVDTLEKKKKVKTVKKLEEELWKIFSEYIRRRDAKRFSGGDTGKCITCQKKGHWKQFDCGHFISRKFKATKFDEKNNHLQCKACNGPYGSGKQYEHGREIDRMYGAGTADLILMKSRQNCKRGAFEYEILIEEYKQKLKKL